MSLRTALRDVSTIRALLTSAEEEAGAGGDELPGVEHLVLAAAVLPDGSGARALAAVGLDVETLRRAVRTVHAEALGVDAEPPATDPTGAAAPTGSTTPTGVFRSTATAQQVFQQASAAARAPGSGGLRGSQVVAAACELQRGTFARALDRVGVDRDRLREAAVAEGRLPPRTWATIGPCPGLVCHPQRMPDGQPDERSLNIAARAAAAERAAAKESAQAQVLIDAFVAEARRRGVPPHPLLAPGRDLRRRRYRTGLVGWYLSRDERVAVDTGGRYYVLRAHGGLRERLTGTTVQPMDPPLVVGRGARDGESIDLDRLLQRRLDEAG